MSQEHSDPDLETRLSKGNSESNLQVAAQSASLADKVKLHAKYFVVDGAACAAFYTPVMTATEYLSGMEWNEIETTRSIGAATSLLSGYGISLLRQYGGKLLSATRNNTGKFSGPKKKIIDIVVGMATTMPPYAPVLYVAGASAKEMMIALVVGSAAAAVAGLTYGHFSDWWRKSWGLESVLY